MKPQLRISLQVKSVTIFSICNFQKQILEIELVDVSLTFLLQKIILHLRFVFNRHIDGDSVYADSNTICN
jgi:hypothetical protein